MNEDEKILVSQAKSSASAFGKLYQLYLDKIYKYIYFRVWNHTTAEDITSDIFYKVLTKIQSFDEKQKILFSTWIFTIAHNTLVDFYRSNSRQKTINLIDDPTDISDHVKNIEVKELYKEAVKLILMLPEKQQEVVMLKYFSEMQNKEIAKLLNVSEKTVASNLTRGLKKIRDEWK